MSNPIDQIIALAAKRKTKKGMKPMERLFTTSGRRAGNTFNSSRKLDLRTPDKRDAFLTANERKEKARKKRLENLLNSFGAGAR
tara:strand:+ start:83 stop:334 length:252 start_codon:yes stop_codon:yes gene_type:complete